ncbi:MAG: DUF952 domain-containing protein [Anaerolineae bacterium]|nr:DUF952 domain-containing protein [Thermoflexales bacterium]MDW8406534.1 DUF952 domain-containing protein [Anaerolineae bacterium]
MILHLVSQQIWSRLPPDRPYAPESLQKEGFIHCTAGEDMLVRVANALYRSQAGEFVVLEIDETKVTSELRWEPPAPRSQDQAAPPEAVAEFGVLPADADQVLFPHIYGPLNRDAIVGVRRARRSADGEFIGIEPAGRVVDGINLKSPAQLADELVDATDAFSQALARFKDQVEARIEQMNEDINNRLGQRPEERPESKPE